MSTQLISGSQPVGSIIKVPYSLTDPNWLLCNGAIVARASYPYLSALLPSVGSFTPTLRTGSVPSASYIASNGTNLVATAPNGTSAVQLSTNGGATWAAQTTPSGFQAGVILSAGANFVVMNQFSAEPIYSPTGAVWTAASGIAGGAIVAGCTNGAGTVLAIQYSSGQAFLSTDAGETYSAITTQTLPTTAAQGPCVYTGTQYLIFNVGSSAGQGLQASTTAASGTWNNIPFLPWGAGTISCACSDGAGNVLAISTIPIQGVGYVSRDGGNTWTTIAVPQYASACSYANGRWFISISYSVGTPQQPIFTGVSEDLNSFVLVPNLLTSQGNNSMPLFAYAGGNYCSACPGGIVTAVENTANMYLPLPENCPVAESIGDGNELTLTGNYQTYIKFQ